jgi:hypothetical protein
MGTCLPPILSYDDKTTTKVTSDSGTSAPTQTVSGRLSCLRARFSHVPYPCSVIFQHLYDRDVAVHTLPRWFTLLGGRLYEQCAVTITLGKLSITGYILGKGLVEHMDRVAGPQKMVGTGIFSKKPRTGLFRRRVILRTAAARPCRSSGCNPPPSCVASCLARSPLGET